MIKVRRVRQPAGFAAAKVEGDAWVAAHPGAARPKDLWSPYLASLAQGFGNRCGYAAMFDSAAGTVDHYLSWKNRPDLAYDWRNYRFAMHWINAKKGSLDAAVLDPHEVGDDWFEVLLPSMQLVLTDKVPKAKRARAQFTLDRLGLGDGEKAIRSRRAWYDQFLAGGLTLAGLEVVAPLIATAFRKQEAKASLKKLRSKR